MTHAAPAGPPLDGLSGVTGAFSAGRKLLTAYGGAYYNLTSGKVDTFYDQSGSGRNLTQVSAAARPVIETVNAHDAISFDGTDDQLSTTVSGLTIDAFLNNNSGLVFASFVFDDVNGSNNANIYDNDPVFADSGGYIGAFVKQGSFQHYNWDGSADVTAAVTISAGTTYVGLWRHDASNLYRTLNGGTEASVASGSTQSMAGLLYLAQGRIGGGVNADIKILEFITMDTDPGSTARAALMTNMMSYAGAS